MDRTVTSPRYRCYHGDLVTGGPLTEVDLVAMTWTAPCTGAGTIRGSFPLSSGEWPTNHADSTVGKRCLVVTYDDGNGNEVAIEGGPIWRTSYDYSTATLTIAAFGLWTYFDHRKLLARVLSSLVEESRTLTFAGSLAQIAVDIVTEVVAAFPQSVPVILPDRDSLGTGPHERNYPAHELGNAGERLKQLTEVIDGPEIQFAPTLVDVSGKKFVRWIMRTGTEATQSMVTQNGPDHVLDVRPVRAGVHNIEVETDGTMLADRTFAAGRGAGEGRPVELAVSDFLVSRGWPALDAEARSTDTVSERSTLQSHAAGRQQVGSRPLRTTTVHWERDGAPDIASVRPGDWCALTVQDDWHIPDGETRQRIVQMSGGNGANAAFVSYAMQEGAL
ncbi:hypothetical protein HMPREF0063_11904 [Aeromicrobium marinum DSM 15272]|uniref:Minor tail protein n=1 Tax=Aeromicrobium marinum DSM 15272 TaxID=585531 RepID=E2SDW8_9ACTN|nr:hypothetical protein HMPREF0063_11904 [Aeromicrobium marinum DSM 15272]